jgi:AraC-like DNA-binding protein
LRVKSTLNFIKFNPEVGLADIALSKGFSDQAHMTREFKQIAKITPKQYSQKVIFDRHSL